MAKKERKIKRIIALFMAVFVSINSSFAYDFEVDGIYYNKTSDSTVSVTYKQNNTQFAYSDYSGDVIIPSSVTYNDSVYNVTAIGYLAFYNCSITSVSIPNTVIEIGGGAFYKCSNLESIILPEGITSLKTFYYAPQYGSYIGAFENCANLKNITIPNSVTYIGNEAFAGCTSLTSITIPNSVDSIGGGIFYHCTSLDTVILGQNITSFKSSYFMSGSPSGDYIGFFEGCISLKKFEIPNSITIIGEKTFAGCTSLTNIEIPNSVTSIGNLAFDSCISLTNVTIPNSVDSIGKGVFYGCSNLKTITISAGIKSLPRYYNPYSSPQRNMGFFENCSSLTSITILDSVTSIGERAFKGCTSLDTVVSLAVIPPTMIYSYYSDNDNSFEYNTFQGYISVPCKSFEDYSLANGWKFFKNLATIKDNINYKITSDSTVSIIKGNYSGNFVIPESVTLDCPGNKTYIVASIDDTAFKACTGLTSVTIPSSVTSIGKNAFKDCTGLTTLNYNADSCGVNVFNNMFSSSYYWLDGCDNLTTVTIGSNVKIIPSYFIYGKSKITSVTIPDSVISIGGSAFDGCTGLTSITIPNSITSIGYSAFEDCIGLTSITIPNSVDSINNYTFSGCTGLTSMTIPSNVTYIGSAAFRNCTGLTSITIPKNVASIRATVFGGCTGLKTLIYNAENCNGNGFQSNSSSEAYHWLYNCDNIEKVVIGNDVKVLPEYFIYGISKVKEIIIPNSVTEIGYKAFSECTGLESVKIGNGITEIGYSAFEGCKYIDTIYCMAKFPPTLKEYNGARLPFEDVNKAINVFVACGRTAYYQAADDWSEFTNIQEDCTIDGFDTDTPSSINLVNQDDNSVIVYPNPTHRQVTVEGEGDVVVTNNLGHVVYRTYMPNRTNKTNKTLTTIDVSGWQSGIYYVKVGETTKKLIVE